MPIVEPNPKAPWLAYGCPNCETDYIGRGRSLQLCPACQADNLRSIEPALYHLILPPDSTFCTVCGIVITPTSIRTLCRTINADHRPQPLPQELLSWLSEDLLSSASKPASPDSSAATPKSSSSPTEEPPNTTPSITPASSKPNS